MEIKLKIFYYIDKFRNSWFYRSQFGRKIILAVLIMILVLIIVIIPNFLSFEASITFFLFLMFAIFLIFYRPPKPSPMKQAGYDWTQGQQQALREEARRRQEQRRINRFFRR